MRAPTGVLFAAALLATALLALAWPAPFVRLGGFEMKTLIVPIVQFVMFGMGMRVSLKDLAGAIRMPGTVAFGIVLQYSVMPALGYGLTLLFGFPDEVAAGVILLGLACAGVSANVMTFLAGGNLALSVTMTSISTLLSPVLTPAFMKLLAGRVVTVSFETMMFSIIRIVVVPVAAGLVAERLLRPWRAGVERRLPIAVMAAVCLVNAIVNANSRDALVATGAALVLSEIIHNFGGYALGYGGARLLGLQTRDAIALSMQVGFRNGGMAAALAMDVLKSSDAALASAVYGTVQNASGALAASLWKRRTETQS